MRVIAGSRRSLPLKTVPKMSTRPTLDRIKETLFNMLNPYLDHGDFLDLFAGSGGIGIEALSRGMRHAYFVDNDLACANVIRENLAFTRFNDEGTVLCTEVENALQILSEKHPEPFSVIFMDPPYQTDQIQKILFYLSQAPYLGEKTIVIFEESIRADLSYLDDLPFTVMKEKKYKTNQHIWLVRK